MSQTFKPARAAHPAQRVARSAPAALGSGRSLAPTSTSAPSGDHHLAGIPVHGSSRVAQLVKGESGIPSNVLDFFGGNNGYHTFKQKNWAKIAQAHEQVYGSPPARDSEGAAYDIDAKVGDQLIANLTAEGWEAHQGHDEAVKRSRDAKKAKAAPPRRQQERPAFRAYKSHEDARSKLKKNPSLGTRYMLKGSDRVYDLSPEANEE